MLHAGDGQLLQGAVPGCLPGNVEQRFGLSACQVDGSVFRSAARTGRWMDSAHGGQQAGAVGVQFDHVLGEALYAAAPPDHWALTTELGFDIIVAPPWDAASLQVKAWAAASGRRGGFAQAELTDDDGTLLGVGSTWIQYVPVRTQSRPDGAGGGVAPPSAVNFATHLGVRLTSQAGDPRADLAEPGLWTNDFGVLHGGVWASLVELAASEVLASRGLRTAHVGVSYLRPPALGSAVSALARPVHAGRSFGVVEVTGQDASGRRCVMATVTGRRRED